MQIKASLTFATALLLALMPTAFAQHQCRLGGHRRGTACQPGSNTGDLACGDHEIVRPLNCLRLLSASQLMA